LNKKYRLSELYPLIKEQLDSGGSASFVTNGVSMKPMLDDGKNTVCIVKPVFPLKKYDIPLYRRSDGAFVLHRIIKVTPDGYVCRGDHQIIKEYPVTDDMIIGVVTEYTKNGRAVRVKGLPHRLYAFIYVHTAYLRLYVRTFFIKLIRRIKR